MRSIDYDLHRNTPEVTVVDNRGLPVRNIRYHRNPGSSVQADERISRQRYNPRGQLTESIDPRLFALQQVDSTLNANFTYLSTLTGEVLRTCSVDAGTTIILSDIAARPLLSISTTGVTCTWQYEDNTLPGRPLSITEQARNDEARITQRFVWAGNRESEQARNLAGQLVYHYNSAGLSQNDNLALNGTPLSVSQQLLKENFKTDWQAADRSNWQNALAFDVFTARSTCDATGALLTQIDAKGNLQRLVYDIAGQLKGSWLTLKGGAEQVIVVALMYSPAGQKLREEHGNGVITTYTYEPDTQRLIGIKTERPAGHPAGPRILQDLRYEYDPVGNVVRVRNDTEAALYWRNQKVVPENTYTYDSLYQLTETNGRVLAQT